MGLITDNLLYDLVLTLLTILFLLYRYLSSLNNYWKEKGIPYVKPYVLLGNMADILLGRRPINKVQMDIYNKLEGERFGGFFEMISPVLLIRDPELIERVLIKDFSHFVDRGELMVDPKKEPLTTGLSLLSGNQWRNMRYKLTPTFTTGKLKGMFEQIYKCGDDLLSKLKEVSENGDSIEAKEVLGLFTTDVIASCAFGLQFKLDTEDGQKFKKMAAQLFNPSLIQMIKFFFANSSARFRKLFGTFSFPKETNEYFINITKTTIKYRQANNINRNDFLQLLLTLREQEKSGKIAINHDLKDDDAYLSQEDFKPASDEDILELTDEVVAAQAFLFLTAGSETISMAASHTLYSLATHPEIERRAQEEVDQVLKKHGGWSYQAVKEMTYLDQVVQESLRFHPFIVVLNRIVTSPYQIPGSKIVLEKGERIAIPVYPIHMDPRVYPDPHKFDPERFKDNNHKTSWKYLPFGDGPRMCIGMRFALLEMKLCLARVLSQFSVSLSEKTSNPLEYDPRSFFPRPKNGIWLHFRERVQQKALS